MQSQQPTQLEPNGLLSYFAENPPVEEEVDIDAALNDQSLDDMMDPQPDNIDGGPMQSKVTLLKSPNISRIHLSGHLLSKMNHFRSKVLLQLTVEETHVLLLTWNLFECITTAL